MPDQPNPLNLPIGNRQPPIGNISNSPALWWPATVVRNWCRIANRADTQSGIRYSTNRRLSAAARPLHPYLTLLHTCFVCLLGRLISCLLSSERSALARSAKTTRTGGRLSNQVSSEIRDRDHRVIERCRHVHNSHGDVLLFFLPKDLLFSTCFCHKLFRISCWLSAATRLAQRKANNRLLLARRFLLRDGCASWSFARPGVRMRALSPHRQAPAMS